MTMSAAALVALWGDELAEVGQARMGNTQMPGREDKASTKDLAAAIVALTTWELWGAGVLGVSFERKKRLGLVTTTKVTLQANAPAATPFAAALAGACQQPRRLEAVLQDAIGGEQLDPAGAVLNQARAELVGAGVLVHSGDSAMRGLAKSFSGKSVFELVPGAAAPWRPTWDALLSRWLPWQQANAGDAEMLFGGARSALAYATSSNT
jgi:hypothetical protein